MSSGIEARSSPSLARLSAPAQWGVTLALSAVIVVALELLRLPAALLLGPMIAAIVVCGFEGKLVVSRPAFYFAQAIVGLMIGRSITGNVLGDIAHDWPIFVGGILSTIVASNALGWFLARRQVLPGTTAIWGASPGAASVMTLMSASYGADQRLVAVMQYLRVVMVAFAASLVARIWMTPTASHAASVDWLPPVDWPAFAVTVLIAGGGAGAGRVLRIPGGPLLLPLALGIGLHAAELVKIELPPLLLAACYALVGWSIGLRFTRKIIAHAARALPQLILSLLVLIALCGLFAVGLVHFAGIDPLTAYLATSPGGADSVAIIAASSTVDMHFVMAMQTARLIIVLITGPLLARKLADLAARGLPPESLPPPPGKPRKPAAAPKASPSARRSSPARRPGSEPSPPR